MKKKLVSADNVAELVGAGAKEFYADASMILTSGAKDVLQGMGVRIVYNKKPAGSQAPCNSSSLKSENLKVVVEKIVSILRNDFQVTDAAKVESVTRKVLCSLKR